jgi:hypothetical protein
MRSRSSHGDDNAEAHAARASTETVQPLYVQKRYVQKLNSTLWPGTQKTENQKKSYESTPSMVTNNKILCGSWHGIGVNI